MKHSMILKFLAVLLAALSLTAAVGCAFGIVALEDAGLYVNGLDELQDPLYASIAKELATAYADIYAAKNLGQLPYTLQEDMYEDPSERSDADHWYLQLSENGRILDRLGTKNGETTYTREYTIAPLYFIASLTSPDELTQETTAPTQAAEEAQKLPDSERSADFEQIQVPEDYLYSSQETILQGGRLITYYLYYYQAPEYSITVNLCEGALDNSPMYLLTAIYPYRYTFVIVLALSLLLAAICMVYLMSAAGCCRDGTVRPGALNRMPLDLYALLAGGSGYALLVLLLRLSQWVENEGPHLGNLSLLGVNVLAVFVLIIAFCFAFAAQLKAKDAFWWRHSIIGWFCGRFAAGLRLLGKTVSAAAQMLPLMWQWIATAALLGISLPVSLLLARWNDGFWILFLLVAVLYIGIVFYSGYCFTVLMKGARQMSQGDLGCKVPTKYLRGYFLECAHLLNALSEAAMIAAKKQIRSERMKSELITNVSHDIKTPLTSIINFVDLLQKPHTQQQQQEYLDVLARQSGQMKKLIEDLMELSKASSGNINVNLQQMDAAESVNQALGEFSDKLEIAGLSSVFRQPEEPVMILADGRLVWRVLFNLLTNAVKYAMPGTRLYVDLMKAEDKVLLSLKNVTREPLNVAADELLERFVRGDVSRNSEGSGLGLNIAQNLMEVQGGQLQLLVDGDLFKATLIFPAAE